MYVDEIKITYCAYSLAFGSTYALTFLSNTQIMKGESSKVLMYRSVLPLKFTFRELEQTLKEDPGSYDFVKRSVKTVDLSESKELFGAWRAMTIRAVSDYSITEDGAHFSLLVKCGYNEVNYKWWPNLPPEWQGMNALVNPIEHWLATAEWS